MFDFFPDEQARVRETASRMPSATPEPGVWGGFFKGTGQLTMQGFARTARAVDLLGSIGPIVQDKLTGGTTAQDRYFKEHDDLFNRAVDYWTPDPGTVGTAGRVAGSVLPMLATAIVSPALAIGTEQLASGEELVREGVAAGKAVAVGATQATGLGLGIWAPIFGNTWATRALVAGAGVNVAQGIVTRAASQAILSGEKAADKFNPWDLEAVAIDALMGIGFGTLAHLTTPSQQAAIATAKQAQHLEDTTLPGRPADDVARVAHVAAMREAVNDVLNERPVNVERFLQDAEFTPRRESRTDVEAEIVRESKRLVSEAVRTDIRGEPTPEAFARTEPETIDVTDLTRPIEQAQAEPTTGQGDPLLVEARESAESRPDIPLKALDDDGNVVGQTTLKEFMDNASQYVRDTESDLHLFQVAASCIIGGR